MRDRITDVFDIPALPAGSPPRLRLPSGMADLEHGEIRHRDGGQLRLSHLELGLLRYLASQPGRPVSRDDILRDVWGMNPERILTRTVDMHVANLRRKLRDGPLKPRLLLSVRGLGYVLRANRGRPAERGIENC